MKKGIELMKVELRHMKVSRWLNIAGSAAISGILIGLMIPIILGAEEGAHIIVGIMITFFWLFFPTMIVRGDAYRIRDPYAKLVVPDIYVLLQLMPLNHKDRAWNRMMSMTFFIFLFNLIAYVVAFVTMSIAGTTSTLFWADLVYIAVAWLILSSISGLVWIVNEPEARKYRHRDLILFFVYLTPIILLFVGIGWYTDLWFLGIVLFFLLEFPIWTLMSLVFLYLIMLYAIGRTFEKVFEKVDYHV